jgi:chromate transporter
MPPSLAAMALFFVRLGLTAFGGPAAHIAMMQEHVVRRRGWLTNERFLDLLSAANLLPGPSSTELAIFIGRELHGPAGLVAAGAGFILPGVLLTLAAAWGYARFGALPSFGGALHGLKPVIVAVVAQALWGLGRTALKTRRLGAIAVLAAAASALGGDAIAVIVGAGVAALGLSRLDRGDKAAAIFAPGVAAGAAVAAAGPPTALALFALFAKTSAVLFGSGYVLLAFLRADLVEGRHWLTEGQLLDAIAVGQITPGPVFSTATFIGYVIAGLKGSAAATLGIFTPAFVLVAVSGPLVARMRKSAAAGAFLDGVNAGSLGLMGVVAVELGRAAVVDVTTAVLGVVSAVLLLRWKVNSAWLVIGGGVVGAVLRAL